MLAVQRSVIYGLLILLLLLFLQTCSATYQVDRQTQEKAGQKHTCTAKLGALGYEHTAEHRKNADKTTEPSKYDELCQQIRSAEAAETQATYAARQFWFGIVNIVLVFIATIAAGAAAGFTWKQANIAETAFKNLERPYVSVVPWQMDLYSFWNNPGDQPRVRLEVRNYGRTPALVDRVAAHLIVANVNTPPGPAVLTANHQVDVGAILATREDDRNYTLRIDDFDHNVVFDALGNGEVYWVAGEVWYSDLTGTRYAYPFEFMFNPNGRSFERRNPPTNRSFPHERIPAGHRG